MILEESEASEGSGTELKLLEEALKMVFGFVEASEDSVGLEAALVGLEFDDSKLVLILCCFLMKFWDSSNCFCRYCQ